MEFEWDAAKDRANRQRHGVSFEEASQLFTSGVQYLEIYDAEHSRDEDRFIAIGPVRQGTMVVVFAETDRGTVRIISARKAAVARATSMSARTPDSASMMDSSPTLIITSRRTVPSGPRLLRPVRRPSRSSKPRLPPAAVGPVSSSGPV